jgi:allantoin racemase
MQNKKILNIMPVVEWNERIASAMDRYVTPGYELHHRNVRYGGIESITGPYYVAVTVPYIVDEILRAEEEGYDAAIVNCCANPGVTEARELVRMPVVGAGEAAYYLSLILADRIGIIDGGGTYRTSSHSSVLHTERRMVKLLGLSERIVSIRGIGLAVEDFQELTIDAFAEAGNKCIEDGAEAIILACTCMTDYVQELEERLDVPVVDPNIAALKFAETLVAMGLTHSKLTIPSPELQGSKCEVKYPPTLRGYR